MSGTRKPKPSKSAYGGGTWSYQPPQSSQNTITADESQNLLCPTALTTLATQSGPCLLPMYGAGWSELRSLGVIHVTVASLPFATSSKNRDEGHFTSCFQSGP